MYVHLIDDPASDTHAVENSHIDNSGHSTIVDGLRAVGPHVWTLCQVDVAWREASHTKLQENIEYIYYVVCNKLMGQTMKQTIKQHPIFIIFHTILMSKGLTNLPKQ